MCVIANQLYWLELGQVQVHRHSVDRLYRLEGQCCQRSIKPGNGKCYNNKSNININVVFNWNRSHNAVHTDHSFTGCGKYFFFFLADQKNAITISCIKPELTRQYPEGELQYRTLVKTGGSGCPQPLATPLPLVTSVGGKQLSVNRTIYSSSWCINFPMSDSGSHEKERFQRLKSN